MLNVHRINALRLFFKNRLSTLKQQSEKTHSHDKQKEVIVQALPALGRADHEPE